jgi:DNA modification methylase
MSTTIYHGNCITGMGMVAPDSVDVVFADPQYNTKKADSKLPNYDKSASIARQKWTDFSASWDVVDDYWGFTRKWLQAAKYVLKPTGSIFICGSHHNIPIVDLVLKEQDWWVCQWIAWCIPNAFPNRELQQQTSANQIIIHARKSKSPLHHYNADRAMDYGELETGRRVNLKDYWEINNDSRAVKHYPFLAGHGAKKPPELVGRALDIALPDVEGAVVLDPFFGTGTTGYVCQNLNNWILRPRIHTPYCVGIELYREYANMCELRLQSSPIETGDGLQLDEKERTKMRKVLGLWAPAILDNETSDEVQAALVAVYAKQHARMTRQLNDPSNLLYFPLPGGDTLDLDIAV